MVGPEVGQEAIKPIGLDMCGGRISSTGRRAAELSVLFLAGVLFTGFRSGVPGPWLDEGATILSAQRPWSSLLEMLGNIDAVHGLYYVMMHLWFDLVGYSPFTLRLPSVLAVAATAVILARLGKRLFSARAGLWTGFAYLVMPSATQYAVEGRSTALAACSVTLAVLFLVEGLHRQSTGWWFGYSLAIVLAVHLFLFNGLVFMVLPVVLWLMPASRRQWARFTIGSSLAAAICIPLLVTALPQRGQVAWIGEPTLRGLSVLPREVWYAFPSATAYVGVAWVILATALAVFSKTMALGGPLLSSVLGIKALTVLVLGWLLAPVVVLVVVSLVGVNVYTPGYLFMTAPALALVIGVSINALRQARWAVWAVASALVMVVLPPWGEQREVDAKAPTAVTATVAAEFLAPGDSVLFVQGEGHGWTRLARYAYPDVFAGTSDLNLGTPFWESTTHFMESDVPLDEVAQERLRGARRVVVVVPEQPTEQGVADLTTLATRGFAVSRSVQASEWIVQVWEA